MKAIEIICLILSLFGLISYYKSGLLLIANAILKAPYKQEAWLIDFIFLCAYPIFYILTK